MRYVKRRVELGQMEEMLGLSEREGSAHQCRIGKHDVHAYLRRSAISYVAVCCVLCAVVDRCVDAGGCCLC